MRPNRGASRDISPWKWPVGVDVFESLNHTGKTPVSSRPHTAPTILSGYDAAFIRDFRNCSFKTSTSVWRASLGDSQLPMRSTIHSFVGTEVLCSHGREATPVYAMTIVLWNKMVLVALDFRS